MRVVQVDSKASLNAVYKFKLVLHYTALYALHTAQKTIAAGNLSQNFHYILQIVKSCRIYYIKTNK